MARFVVEVTVDVDEQRFAELLEAGRDAPDSIAGWLEYEIEDALKCGANWSEAVQDVQVTAASTVVALPGACELAQADEED